MAITFHGSWPQPLPIVIQWLHDKAKIEATPTIPENLRKHLPAVIVSPAPGGGTDDYTRSRAVDIDIYAADWQTMDETIGKTESALASLQGDGNRYGYVDASTLTSFSEVSHSMPDVLRCTATVTLSTRPQ
ncbi:hypothetical protein ABJC08_02855 [Bifidobacterium adolescentis]